MQLLLKILRGLALSVLGFLVVTLVSVAIGAFVLGSTLLDKQTAQSWLARPESYQLFEQAVSAGLSQQEPTDAETDAEQVQALRQLIDDHLTEEKFEQIVTEVSGGVFDWLEGEQAVDFEVRLFDNRQELEEFFIDAQLVRLQGLEPCTPPELLSARNDLFNIDCRPPDVDRSLLVDKFAEADDEQVEELLAATTISDESLELTSPDADTAQLQTAYQLVKLLPLLAIYWSVLLLTLALLIIRDWRRWLSYSGRLLVVPAVSALITGVALLITSDSVIRQLGQRLAERAAIEPQVLLAALEPISSSLAWRTIIVGLVVLAAGVLMMLAGRLLSKPAKPQPPAEDELNPPFRKPQPESAGTEPEQPAAIIRP